MSFCNITIVGRLGRDAEVRVTPQGKEVVTANVAAGYKDKSNWFKVTAWDKLGSWLKDAKKGDQVYVDGNLEVRTYEKKTGGTGTELMINAHTIRIFKKEQNEQLHEAFGGMSRQSAETPLDEDIPF